jgi:hypothetical protein
VVDEKKRLREKQNWKLLLNLSCRPKKTLSSAKMPSQSHFNFGDPSLQAQNSINSRKDIFVSELSSESYFRQKNNEEPNDA